MVQHHHDPTVRLAADGERGRVPEIHVYRDLLGAQSTTGSSDRFTPDASSIAWLLPCLDQTHFSSKSRKFRTSITIHQLSPQSAD